MKQTEKVIPLEQIITSSSNIDEAFSEMKQYRDWSASTLNSYSLDERAFTQFCMDIGVEPIISNAKLHIVLKWIKAQKKEQLSIATIRRRIASLSSIFEFYKNIGVVQSNPFKAIQLPVEAEGHHSPIMDFDQLKQVYHHLQELKKDGTDIEVTVKTMLFTGLRNEALTKLTVKDVLLDRELICYDAGIINRKHKVQFFPIPPVLFSLIQRHIHENHLTPEDSLLYGIQGQPLQNKQLNRITNKICQGLGWSGEERVTPHGFRATIATLLDERGNLGHDAIKFLLGHSEKENLKFYLRRDQRKINQLRRELTQIEKELESSLAEGNELIGVQNAKTIDEEGIEQTLSVSEDVLIKLLGTHPKLAIELIQKGYSKFEQNDFSST